jgi:hypothetical protein
VTISDHEPDALNGESSIEDCTTDQDELDYISWGSDGGNNLD